MGDSSDEEDVKAPVPLEGNSKKFEKADIAKDAMKSHLEAMLAA